MSSEVWCILGILTLGFGDFVCEDRIPFFVSADLGDKVSP
jgi:hypothetical protein